MEIQKERRNAKGCRKKSEKVANHLMKAREALKAKREEREKQLHEYRCIKAKEHIIEKPIEGFNNILEYKKDDNDNVKKLQDENVLLKKNNEILKSNNKILKDKYEVINKENDKLIDEINEYSELIEYYENDKIEIEDNFNKLEKNNNVLISNNKILKNKYETIKDEYDNVVKELEKEYLEKETKYLKKSMYNYEDIKNKIKKDNPQFKNYEIIKYIINEKSKNTYNYM